MSTSTPQRTAEPAPAGGSGGLRRRAENRTGLVMIAPTLVLVGVLVVLPILWTVLLAFQELRLLNLRTTGLFGRLTIDNITYVFTSGRFWSAMGTTLAYSVLGTAGAIGVGLAAALALRRPFPGRGLVRAAMLLPYVAPIVAVTFTWSTLLNPQFGWINAVGQRVLGWDEPIAFLTSAPAALISIILFETWRSFPFAFLFLTARLQAIPGVLEEAARVDGAGVTQRFRYIVAPQLLPTIAVLSVLRFIWTFNSFDDIWLLTGGAGGTEVMAVSVYNAVTARGDIGGAAAQALALAAVLAVLVGLYLRFVGRREEQA